MQIFHYELGPIGVNCFLILPENSGAVLIDAPEGSFDAVKDALKAQNKDLAAVLLTHGHWDHIWDAKKIRDYFFNSKIYAHPDGRKFIEEQGAQSAYMFGESNLESVKIDCPLFDGQFLQFGDCKIKALHTPGHCAGSMSFIIEEKKLAFVGDLLFAQSVGRTDLPTGSFADLEKSVRNKIYTLPDDFEILPGHGEFTTVAAERRSNPYVGE
ncbi:MAG: MBL fold metallo-hydrolase [Opitutales bacterium]|nr:MBL fold metallo-hydrolase [Opitutales bacterium]